MKTAYALISTFALALASTGLGGCYADAEAEPVAGPPVVATDVEEYQGYRPMYYNGYVVYYDNYARPYYYYGGRVMYVPRGYVGYGALVGHYYAYRPYYAGWYGRYGVRYRTWRGYYGYRVRRW
jgi:hypothetical protein